MALPRVLQILGLKIKELLPVNASTGAPDAEKLIATDVNGKLDASFLPAGVGTATFVVPASEALTAGDFVNLHANVGVTNARKSDNTSYKPADGFVLAASASAANATVYPLGEVITGLTGLSPGVEYFLGAAGAVVATPPTAANSVYQRLGIALGATSIATERGLPVERT